MTDEQIEAIEWAAGRAHVASLGKPIAGVEGRRWRVLRDLLRDAYQPSQAHAHAAEAVYQERISENGLWMDTTKQTHDDIISGKLSSKGVRVVYTTPPASPVENNEPNPPGTFEGKRAIPKVVFDNKTGAGNKRDGLTDAQVLAYLEPIADKTRNSKGDVIAVGRALLAARIGESA